VSQKLIKRTIFTDHLKILTDRQDELLQQLALLTKEGFPKAQEEWEKSVVAWGASCLCMKLFVNNMFIHHRASQRESQE